MKETLKNIKHHFFAFRNGIVADAVRKQTGREVVFGLQVPQLAEMARSLTPSMELADTLWADRKVRESRLLATYLFPIGEVTREKAFALAADVETVEEADMLAFRLLKRLPFAPELLEEMTRCDSIPSYMKKTLANHLK